MNQIEKLKLHQQVERILHVPGNYLGGILEMAFVLDYHISKEVLMENLKEIGGITDRQQSFSKCSAEFDKMGVRYRYS